MEHNKCIHSKTNMNGLSNLSHGFDVLEVTSMIGMNLEMGN